jgi:hypothetical protein
LKTALEHRLRAVGRASDKALKVGSGRSLIKAEHRRRRGQRGSFLVQETGRGEVVDGPLDRALLEGVFEITRELLKGEASGMLIEKMV